MRLNSVALTSSYCNDKGFYHIRSSLPIIALQFFVDIDTYKTTIILNVFVRNLKLLGNNRN